MGGHMTKDERAAMINAQLKQYEQKMFQLEMNKTAVLANGDAEGAKDIEARIEALKKAYTAVEGMKEEI